MRIPESKVQEIYQAADIVEVIQDFVQLKRRGANWVGLSPFKNEKTPSFTVSPAKGIFKDFSSGKGGNAVHFLMELEGYTYPEALLYLAKKYHIEVQVADDPAFRDAESRRQSLYILNEFAMRYFQSQLTTTAEGKAIGLSYFTERGISRESVEQFQLGYSPEDWDAFTREALAAKFDRELLLHSGLTLTNEAGDKTFDRYRGRVIFPIHTPAGKIAGFGGRILKSDAKAAKYVNSPESDVYHKSEVLYGLFFARETIRKQNEVILAEGYLDVISLHQRGIQHVVAASGTALSEVQVKTLARLTKNIVLVNDADTAGISATNRAIDLLLEKEMNVSTVLLPEGEDPDSFVRQNGADAFREYLQRERKDFVDFRIHTAPQNMLTPSGKATLVDSIAQSISRIPDMVLRQAWVQAAAQKLNFPEQAIISAVNRALTEAGKAAARLAEKEQQPDPSHSGVTVSAAPEFAFNPFDSSRQEKEILRLILNHHSQELEFKTPDAVPGQGVKQSLLEYIYLELSDFTFTNPLYNRLREIIFKQIETHAPFDPDALLNSGDPEIASLVAELLVVRDQMSSRWKLIDAVAIELDANILEAVDSSLHYFITYHIERLLTQVKEQIKELLNRPDYSQQELDGLLNKVMRLEKTSAQHSVKKDTIIKGFISK